MSETQRLEETLVRAVATLVSDDTNGRMRVELAVKRGYELGTDLLAEPTLD